MDTNDRLTARRMADAVLQNHDNTVLGQVEDLILEPVSGKVTHVMVSIPAKILRPARRVLVPWETLRPMYDGQIYLTAALPADLEALPDVSWDLGHRGIELDAPQGKGATACWDADPNHG